MVWRKTNPVSNLCNCFLRSTPTTLDFDIVVDVTTVEQHRGSRHRFVLPVEGAVSYVFWKRNSPLPTIVAVDTLTTEVALKERANELKQTVGLCSDVSLAL